MMMQHSPPDCTMTDCLAPGFLHAPEVGGFLKLEVLFSGFLIIRGVAFWGIYRVPLFLGDYQFWLAKSKAEASADIQAAEFQGFSSICDFRWRLPVFLYMRYNLTGILDYAP